MLKVLSLGAGVQSTTVLLMSCHGELPRLDAAVFADTGWEPAEVYKHLAWLEVEAKWFGIPVHRTSAMKRLTPANIREDAIEFVRLGSTAYPAGIPRPMIPYFLRKPDGSIGAASKQCTQEYKIDAVERFIRRNLLGLKPGQRAPEAAVEHWLGISADEPERQRKSRDHWRTFRYPLITDIVSPASYTTSLYERGYDRMDCHSWMDRKGYPRSPKSSCIGCPYHSDSLWLYLKTNHPSDWADAVAFDKEIRIAHADGYGRGKLDGVPYLHRSCVPLDEVILKPSDSDADMYCGAGEEAAASCGV